MFIPAVAGHILALVLSALPGQADSRPAFDVASDPKKALAKATELVDQKKPDTVKATAMLIAILQTGREVTPGPYKAATRPGSSSGPKSMMESITSIDEVRCRAALLLSELLSKTGKRIEKQLIGLLRHRRADVRFLACMAMGNSEAISVGGYRALRPLLKDKNPLIRRSTCLAFQNNMAPSNEAIADIAALLADKDKDVFFMAFATLVELGAYKHIPVGYIARALKTKDMTLVEDGLIAAASKGKDAKVLLPHIRALLATEGDFSRARVMRVFGWLAKDLPEVIPDLVAGLSDKNAMVRVDAAVQLGKLGPAAKQTLAALRAALLAEKLKGPRSAMEQAIKAISAKKAPGAATRPAPNENSTR